MASGVPVITSSIHHFEDLPTIKADSPADIASALERLFESKAARQEQVKRQNDFVVANDWNATAERYLALLTKPNQ
jgi:hypothetical protein